MNYIPEEFWHLFIHFAIHEKIDDVIYYRDDNLRTKNFTLCDENIKEVIIEPSTKKQPIQKNHLIINLEFL